MTTTKKLVLAAACIIGMQYSVYGYDVNACRYETAVMLNFSQSLRQIRNSKQALTTAQWLEDVVVGKYGYIVTNQDIIAITSVITNTSITNKTKCTILAQTRAIQAKKIAEENAYIRRSAINRIFEGLAIATILAGLMALAIYDALYIQPFRPKVIVQQTPGLSLSYSPTSGLTSILSVGWDCWWNSPYYSTVQTIYPIENPIIVINS